MCNKLILLLLIVSSNAFALTWEPPLGIGSITTTPTSITKTATAGFNVATRSVENAVSGDTEVSFVHDIRQYVIGLQSTPISPTGTFSPIDFGITLDGTTVYTVVSGSVTAIVGVSPVIGQTYTIAVEALDIVYYEGLGGSKTEIARLVAPIINYPLYVGASLSQPNAQILSIQAFPVTEGTFIPIPTPNTPPPTAITTKGGLLTKDVDLKRVEFPACTNGKILGFNSSTATGLDCLDNL